MGESIVIVSVGASTSLGRDALSTAAAVRAGLSGFSMHPWMVDEAGEPVRIARAPWLDIDCSGVERFEALIAPAISEALEPWDRRSRLTLALALPSLRPGITEGFGRQLLERLRQRRSVVFDSVACFPAGHAAGIVAMRAACDQLLQRGADACLVAAVDSHLDPHTLEALESAEQLHGAGRRNNAWGLIPGEGAAALLLTRGSDAVAAGLRPLATLLATGHAVETHLIGGETVCLGEGLTGAFRQALTGLPAGTRVSDVYCDMNGEPYRADEFGFAALRTGAAFDCASDFIAPADCWGDVAAAGGGLHVVLALVAGSKGYARGRYALIWASAEPGGRAAALFDLGQEAMP